jgi:hypothetical protein
VELLEGLAKHLAHVTCGAGSRRHGETAGGAGMKKPAEAGLKICG